MNRVLVFFSLLVLSTTQSSASGGSQLPRVGWVYRIEGHLNEQPVTYVGSASDLKRRLVKAHKWSTLLAQEGTKVYTLEVFAKLDVQASHGRTPLSARAEALRAAEQRALDQVRASVEKMNRDLPVGDGKETLVLNEVAASADVTLWETRHQVTTSGAWQLLGRRIAGTTPRLLAALTLLDIYWMYRETKLAQYIIAPYILGDEQGFFTLEQRSSLINNTYHKAYLRGPAEGQRIEISASEFNVLKEEAESLWGTTDWAGDFVPGLLNRTLPIVRSQDALRMQ